MAHGQSLGFASSYHGGTELPQTGNDTSDNIALLGASLASCLALLGIAARPRKLQGSNWLAAKEKTIWAG